MSVAEHNLTSRITYTDLYRRWEQNNWSAMDLDFSRDKEGWDGLSEIQRKSALWIYSMFFFGEDSVTDNLSPYIDAAPLEEQKYFLATQQVDEARHAIFFHRFFSEVIGAGDDIAATLAFTEQHLGWGYRQVFNRLDKMADELRRDRSLPKFAQAITLYHLVVEASHGPARPALHRGLLRPRGDDARIQRRHGARLPRRAAPHRLRRQGPQRAPRRVRRVPGRRRRAADRGDAVALVGLHPAQLGPRVHPLLRLRARGDRRLGHSRRSR